MKENNTFDTGRKPTWCPGCGNFVILEALKLVFQKGRVNPQNTVIVYGIGCHGNMFNSLKITAFEGLHGRALPVCQGMKLVRPELNVVAVMGDGDALGEGGNHLLHTCRRNLDITALIHDNRVFALTTGQASPSSLLSFKTKSTPLGNKENPIDPLEIAVVAGASFVARVFTGNVAHTAEIIEKAIKHKGFSVIDILQPCVSSNPLNTHEWYKENTYYLGKDYISDNRLRALEKTREKKIALGVIYEGRPGLQEETVRKIEKKTFSSLLADF